MTTCDKKTCSTCWYYFQEPFTDHLGETFVGCGNDHDFVLSRDPATHQPLTFGPVIASDAACPEYLNQQEGEEQAEKWNAMTDAEREETYQRETLERDIQAALAKASPAFTAAMAEVLRLQDLHGDDHRAALDAFMQAVELAPEALQAILRAKAHEMGLFPKACGYTEDGEPVYRLEDAAEKLGIPADEAEASIERFMDAGREAGHDVDGLMVDPVKTHLVQ